MTKSAHLLVYTVFGSLAPVQNGPWAWPGAWPWPGAWAWLLTDGFWSNLGSHNSICNFETSLPEHFSARIFCWVTKKSAQHPKNVRYWTCSGPQNLCLDDCVCARVCVCVRVCVRPCSLVHNLINSLNNHSGASGGAGGHAPPLVVVCAVDEVMD